MRKMLMFYILLGLSSITASQTLTGISLHKPVQLSSRSSSHGPPEVATDGEYNCSNIYTCTEEEVDPWLTIDLQGLHYIHEIELDLAYYERSESGGLETLIGNDSFAKAKNTAIRCGLGYSISCQPPVLGSHVTIRSTISLDTSALCVCEVLVTGTRDPSITCVDGKFGDFCQNDCPVNCKDSRCSKEDGACQCMEGYTGDRCLTRCSAGRYGPGCSSTCSAGCSDTCDPISGACACKPGWFSSDCQERCSPGCNGGLCDNTDGACAECVAGKWDGHCQHDCPVNCKDSRCNKENGACQECVAEKWGDNCQLDCPVNCKDSRCNKEGTCQCKEGYTGDRCQIRGRSGGDRTSTPGKTGDSGGVTVITPGNTGSTDDGEAIGRGDPGLPVGTSILVGFGMAGAMISITIVALYCIHRKRTGHVKEEVQSTDAKDKKEVRGNRRGGQGAGTSFDGGDAQAHSRNGDRHSYVNYPRNPYETLDAAQVQNTEPNTYQELKDTR